MISRAARRHARDLFADVTALLRGSLAPMLLVFLFGYGFADEGIAWLPLNVLLVIPLSFVAVALHEGGHAAAGLAVGMRPFRIVMGMGRTIAKRVVREEQEVAQRHRARKRASSLFAFFIAFLAVYLLLKRIFG